MELQNQATAQYGDTFRSASIKSLFGGNTMERGGGVCGDSILDGGEDCDDGNTASGDGCSATCLFEAGFDCSAPIPGAADVNVVTDGSLENSNLDGDWTEISHSLFGQLICGDNCFGAPLASDIDGNIVSGNFFLVSGGSFTSASTGVVEHAPIVIPAAGTTLQFNYGFGTPGTTCPDANDGLRLLIDGTEVWSNLDATGSCEPIDVYTVESVDLAALGLNDDAAHTLRFEGTSSVVPAGDDLLNVFLDQVRILVPADDPTPPIPSMCSPVTCGDGAFPQFSAAGSEGCDDGNLTDGDGCSSTCEVEQPDFVCEDPEAAADEGNDIEDGSLEQGRNNPDWVSAGTEFDPICSQIFCGAALADTEDGGAFFAWFGGSSLPNDQSLTQDVVISSTATTLDFKLLVGICDSVNDNLSIEVDGTNVFDFPCDDSFPVYTPISVPLGAFADGASHTVSFIGSTVATNGGNSNFFVDDISIGTNVAFAGEPGVCFELAEACSVPEQFSAGIPGDWTVVNLGPDAADGWGASNDGICASQNWSGGNAENNTTGGAGIAACADSDATGQIDLDGGATAPNEMDTYLCSPMLDLSAVTDPQLSFLVNYQAANNDFNDNGTPDDAMDDFDDDFLEVLVGTTPPNALTVPNYDTLGNVFDHLDTTLATSPEAALAADLTDFATESEAYVCFHYRGTYAWFAQVDNPALRATSCTNDDIDTDGDGVFDMVDNCIMAINSTQLDTDGDGHGNACDADFNNDCSSNVIDLGIFRTLFFQPGNQADLNGDGITNVIDLGIFRTLFFGTPGPSADGICTPM
ncbi:MAG: DUF4215 domain-containing protein [Gammaproteobacteria bacterium]